MERVGERIKMNLKKLLILVRVLLKYFRKRHGMIISKFIRQLLIYGVAAISTSLPLCASADCNNHRSWIEPPTGVIKTFIGYKQEGQDNLGEITNGSPARVFPLILPTELVGRSGSGELSKVDTSAISYFEPDGKGNWRVCRIEWWWPPSAGSGEADRVARRQVTRQYTMHNPALAHVQPSFMALSAILYFYDSKGRVVKVAEGDFENPGKAAVIQSCRRYDDMDRIILEVNPKTSQICPEGDPDPRDSWRRYRYGEFKGAAISLLVLGHSGESDGSWKEKSYPFRLGASPDAPWGNAEADSKNGVTLILGSNLGKLDDNAANTVVDSYGRWDGSTYFFTTPPVPVSVLEHPDEIYNYDRRRQTYVDGQIVKLYEFFKAHEHLSRHRYYMMDDYVLRHEQLDAKGKVVRVITVDDWRQPRPGPKPDVNDKLLGTRVFALLDHQIYHRVYDISVTGKPVLVAVSWNRPVRLNPLKNVPIDYADLVYGTPNGKIRWKNQAEFERAFNTSAHAAQVFFP